MKTLTKKVLAQVAGGTGNMSTMGSNPDSSPGNNMSSVGSDLPGRITISVPV